ncbi:MAG: cell wall-binding repeat-containing protein [Solirubrobacterales bacterium]
MARDKPINADVPEREEPEKDAASGAPEPKAAPGPAPPPPQASEPEPKRRRPHIPGALLLIGGLVVLAIGLVVLAVVAGSGGGRKGESTASGPAPAPVVVPAEAAGEDSDGEAAAAESSEGLGYPAFATDNTTRVGGATPAENAAAVALAVFPSTTPAQRPAAVALIAEDDWPAAIAAAVLMAPPLRVPLLFSGPDSTPEASEEALAALAPQGSGETSGARGFAFGSALVPESLSGVETIRGAASDAAQEPGSEAEEPAGEAEEPAGEGEEPAATAAAIADLRDRLFGSAPKAIVLAPLSEPGFAAPAAAWAARSGDPVLFTETKALPKATEDALKKHAGVPVYVLGPSAAIAGSVLAQVKKLGNPVQRVSGTDPVKNALAFARYSGGEGFGWDVNDPGHGFVLSRADAPLDAAAAAPLSAAGTWGPLLLTDGAGTLPAEVRNYLLNVKPGYTTNPTRAYYNHVWVIGDQEAIDVKQQAEANELAELAKIGAE